MQQGGTGENPAAQGWSCQQPLEDLSMSQILPEKLQAEGDLGSAVKHIHNPPL